MPSDELTALPGDFEEARRETLRYHEEFYASTALGQAGTWLEQPHALLYAALRLLAPYRPVTAYDLGSGVGRHTIPLLRHLPAGSEIYAVDLLPSALQRLEAVVPPVLSSLLHTCPADLDDFEFATGADLVLAFSAVEHLPDVAAVGRLLDRIAAATRPGGVVALGVIADRVEVHPDGTRRPALVESGLSAGTARRLIAESFRGFVVEKSHVAPASVTEERDGATYVLESQLVTWIGVRPGAPRDGVTVGRRTNG